MNYNIMKTVCLCMIMKNEEHVLKRNIDSWKGKMDYWIIIDTGSTDKSIEIVKKELEGYPGELLEQTWVNMGHNRKELMKASRNKADYHFILDADEYLVLADNWKKELQSGEDILWIDGGKIGWTNRILLTACNWTYNMAWHATPSPTKNITKKTKYISNKYIKYYHGADGIRWKKSMKEKYMEVVKDLEKERTEKGEKDKSAARRQYYIAQSYKDATEYSSAIREFRKRISMGGWGEEIYWSYIHIARITKREEDFLEAFKFCPNRIEALAELCNLFIDIGNNKKALQYAEIACGLKNGTQFMLFTNNSLYEWIMLNKYLQLCFKTNKYRIGAKKGLKELHISSDKINSKIITNVCLNMVGVYLNNDLGHVHTNDTDIINEFEKYYKNNIKKKIELNQNVKYENKIVESLQNSSTPGIKTMLLLDYNCKYKITIRGKNCSNKKVRPLICNLLLKHLYFPECYLEDEPLSFEFDNKTNRLVYLCLLFVDNVDIGDKFKYKSIKVEKI